MLIITYAIISFSIHKFYVSLRYPRTMDNSMRKKDTRRAQKRAEVKQRKEQEKQQKKEELKQLKVLKRKEIEEKIEKLKEITGYMTLTSKHVEFISNCSTLYYVH